MRISDLLPDERQPLGFYLKEAVDGALNRNGERTAIQRWALFGLLRRSTPSVAVEHDGIRYYVSTSDNVVGRVTFCRGSYEQDMMARCIALIEEVTGRAPLLRGRTFVDIGANIGTSVIPAVRVFGAERAVAFEPAPETFKLLRCNLIANDLEDRVTAFPMALSDKAGTSTLELSEGNWGDHRVRAAEEAGDGSYRESGRRTVDVEQARFDDLVDESVVEMDDVGLVWIDTQGHEGHVLAGAKSVLDSSVPVMLEYWPYGLERSGGLTMLHELISANYRTVVDVRASMAADRVVTHDAARIHELGTGLRGTSFTDIALLK